MGALPNPTRPGFTFVGWFNTSAATGGTQFTQNSIINANTTMWVRWQAINNGIVTFEPNGGIVIPASRNVIHGNAVGTLPIPTGADHIFVGWFNTNAVIGGVQRTSGFIVTGDTTFWARWQINAPNITNPGRDSQEFAHGDLNVQWNIFLGALSAQFHIRVEDIVSPGRPIIEQTLDRQLSNYNFLIRANQLVAGRSYRINLTASHGNTLDNTAVRTFRVADRVQSGGRIIGIPQTISGTITTAAGNVTNVILNSRGNWFAFYTTGTPIDSSTGRIRIAVGPRILNPNYPDTGPVQEDEFNFPINVDVVLRNIITGVQRILLCIVTSGGVKAHTFNHYPHPDHPRNALFINEQVQFHGIQSGLHQTGIAYPRSSNARDESQWDIEHMDGSTVEFRASGTQV